MLGLPSASVASLLCLFAAFPGDSLCLQFTEDPYSATVNETAPSFGYPRPQDGFVRVSCIDEVSGTTPGDVVYSISTTSHSGPFSVDNATGSILTLMDLDSDSDTALTYYSFEVDCVSSGLSATALVQISIESVNEFSPFVVLLGYTNATTFHSTNINETTPTGTIVASGVHVPGNHVKFNFSDLDRGPDGNLTYLLIPGDPSSSSFFDIDPLTGLVTVQRKIDVDSLSSAPVLLSLNVSACDRVGLMDSERCPSVQFWVIVDPVNNHQPHFTQALYVTSNNTYLEQDYLNVHISTVQCVDGDMHNVGALAGVELWNASSYVHGVLVVDSDGELFLNGTLDFEQGEELNVTLRCMDTGDLEDFSTVVIRVTATNDNMPRFQHTNYTFSVDRIELPDDASIGQVQADDADIGYGGTITYSMETNSNFDIDTQDGTIFLTDYLLAAEVGSSVELVVRVSDGEFIDTALVTVRVNGPLSVLDIILVEAAFVLLLLLSTLVCCCCWYLRKRRIKKSRRRPQSYHETQAKVRTSGV